VIARYVDLRYGRRGQEVMGALYLNARHGLLGDRELLHRAAVEPPEVLSEGLPRDVAGVDDYGRIAF
jgi:hypothetical protein